MITQITLFGFIVLVINIVGFACFVTYAVDKWGEYLFLKYDVKKGIEDNEERKKYRDRLLMALNMLVMVTVALGLAQAVFQ